MGGVLCLSLNSVISQTGCQKYGNLAPDVVIQTANGSGSVFTSTLGVTFYQNQLINIKSNLVIDEGVFFAFINCRIKVDPGKSITVLGGRKLVISQNSELFSCGKLWKGIMVGNNKGKLEINDSKIEDAEIAVHAQEDAQVILSTARFDRNLVSVKNFKDSFGNWATFSLTMTGCTISCTSNLNGPYPSQSMPSYTKSLAGLQLTQCTNKLDGYLSETSPVNLIKDCNIGIELSKGFLELNAFVITNCQSSNGVYLTANSEPLPSIIFRGGNGIYAHGDGKLTANGPARPCTIDENWGSGILVEKAMSLRAFYSNFTNNRRYGIEAINNSIASTINISSCTINVGPTKGLGGIYVERSTGKGLTINNRVLNNTINVQKAQFGSTVGIAHGILINGINGAKDYMDIQGNILNLNTNRNCHGILVYPVASMDLLRITDNNIRASSATSRAGWGIGMLDGPTAGKKNLIKANQLNNFTEWPIVDDQKYSLFCGVHVQNTQSANVCGNTMKQSEHGFHGWATNDNTSVLINSIDKNNAGLRLHQGAFISPQACKGNKFYSGGIYNASAEVLDAKASPFTISTNVAIELPSTQKPSDFFRPVFVCNNVAPSTCPVFFPNVNLAPIIKDWDIDVARGNYPGSGGQSHVFESKLQVFNNFLNYPGVYVSNYSLDSFMVANSNTIIGKIVKFDAMIGKALTVPDAIITQFNSSVLSIDNRVKKLNDLDSLIALNPTNSVIQLQQRELDQDTLNTLILSHTGLKTTYLNTRNQMLDTLVTLVNSITTSNTIELDAKQVRLIHALKTRFQNDTLSSVQVGQLGTIADKCEDSGGSSVGYAVGLLGGFGIVNQSLMADQPCNAGREHDHHDESIETINVFPNPNSGQLKIQANEPISSIELFDVTGRQLSFSKNINNLQFELNVNESGVYYVRVSLNSGKVITKTISTIK